MWMGGKKLEEAKGGVQEGVILDPVHFQGLGDQLLLSLLSLRGTRLSRGLWRRRSKGGKILCELTLYRRHGAVW